MAAPKEGAFTGLFTDICGIVDAARTRFANSANAEIVLEYWSIGMRINKEVLHGRRALYGDRTVERLSFDLCRHYVTKEFNLRNLRRMMQFAQEFPQAEIVSRVATQLSWSHIVELKGFYSERDLEDVLISGIQSFLLELGTGFAFLARQKHMIIDGEDYFLDLLFYHRTLRPNFSCLWWNARMRTS